MSVLKSMPVLGRLSGRLKLLLVTTGALASGVTALGVAQPASATYETYSCAACSSKNGPEAIILNSEATNYETNGICSAVWRHNADGSYGLLVDECTQETYKITACYTGSEFKGHGELEKISLTNQHLAGHEDNYKYCG
ncbi:MAG TPA: hypothetical protein VGF95_12250 [Solirubrobacteraceae bacterium]|jgi:hypothetical protein